jgi:hypothetical protein
MCQATRVDIGYRVRCNAGALEDMCDAEQDLIVAIDECLKLNPAGVGRLRLALKQIHIGIHPQRRIRRFELGSPHRLGANDECGIWCNAVD